MEKEETFSEEELEIDRKERKQRHIENDPKRKIERFWEKVEECFFRLNGFYQEDIKKYPEKDTQQLREMYVKNP